MKVALGFRVVEGPWGGGNRFARALAESLRARGDSVVFGLADDDIDIVMMLDPRWRHPASTFTPGEVFRYVLLRNPNALVVHRINECDERKNTSNLNKKLRIANYCADHTVFVGSWLRALPVWQGSSDYSVIMNGADPLVFYPDDRRPEWSADAPLSLVTHHWGGNWMKGFDIYERIDRLLDDEEWCRKIRFSYIGNLPKGFHFRNARYVPPLDGVRLADELRSHDAYVTASINEPGGNHQNEGALCGLPLLYRRSGCMPEYCEGFGEAFDENDFEAAVERLRRSYSEYRKRMGAYPNTSERMCSNYLELFDRLLMQRDALQSTRQLLRDPWAALRTQFPL